MKKLKTARTLISIFEFVLIYLVFMAVMYSEDKNLTIYDWAYTLLVFIGARVIIFLLYFIWKKLLSKKRRTTEI
jgi:hypothetical protein